jgi:hypothetical protein
MPRNPLVFAYHSISFTLTNTENQMIKLPNNAPKRLAQAAVLTLAITGVSVPSFALEHTSLFSIDVQAAEDPCGAFTDFGATWMPDSFVTLTDASDSLNTNFGQLTVEPGDSINMTVGLSFLDGETCGVATGPTGNVTAAWTMLSGDLTVDDGSNTCAVGSPCSAATTSSIEAAVSVPVNAVIGMNLGKVDIVWVP